MTAAAGIATLELLTPEAYEELEEKGDYLRSKLKKLFSEVEAPMGVTGVASLFALQFTPEPVTDYRSFAANDKKMQRTMFVGLMNEGYLMSNRCAGNVALPHEQKDLDGFVDAVGRVLERASKVR